MRLGHVAFLVAALCLYLLSPLVQAGGLWISQHGSPAQGRAEAETMASFFHVGLLDHGWSMGASMAGLAGAELDHGSDWVGGFQVQNVHLLVIMVDASWEPGEARQLRP